MEHRTIQALLLQMALSIHFARRWYFCYKKVLQIIFSITAMDDHIALAFEMRRFAPDSFREVPVPPTDVCSVL